MTGDVDLDYISSYVKCKPYKSPPSKIENIREALELWLPPVIPKEVVEDFIQFFTLKITGRVDELEAHRDPLFTGFKIKFGLGGYRGIADFIFWDEKLEGQLLEQLLPLLHKVSRLSKKPLTTEQFVSLVTDLCYWVNLPLTPLDVNIITTIHKMPFMTVPSLARLLHASYKRVHSRWSRLKRLDILRITALPNYRSIGLRPVIVELHNTRNIIVSPYILSKLSLTGSEDSTLYVMVIPEERLGCLIKALDREMRGVYSLHLAENRGHTISFTYYRFDDHAWDINWRKLFLGVHLLYKEIEERERPKKEREEEYRPYVPDKHDTKLIPALMSDATMKLELLSQKVGLSLSQVSRRRSRLINTGVLRLETVLRRVGLIEEIVLKIDEQDTKMIGLIKEFPQAWVTRLTDVKTGKRQFLVYTTLPAGSFVRIRHYITRYVPTRVDVFISGPESGGWPLSFENYDVEKGCWIWQEPEVVKPGTEKVLTLNSFESRRDYEKQAIIS